MDRCPCPSGQGAGGQRRLDPGTCPRRGKRVRAGLRPAVRVAREHAAGPVRGRHWCGPRGRSDGQAPPLGRPRPGARDPARGRRSRRTARRAVRVRQPTDRRRRARRRGRGHRLTTRPLRSRRDRAHQVLRRPGDVARRQRASAAPGRFCELFGRPAQQAQWARLQALGLNTDSDLERSLGRRVVESTPDA